MLKRTTLVLVALAISLASTATFAAPKRSSASGNGYNAATQQSFEEDQLFERAKGSQGW
jgi:hypothetical protein